jgi:hypothetical protein
VRGPAYGGPGDDVDAAEPGDACIETAGVAARDGALPGRRSPERPHESELPAATTRAIRETVEESSCRSCEKVFICAACQQITRGFRRLVALGRGR